MDREGADFESTMNEIRDRLEANPVAIQIPVGEGPPHIPNAFRAVIDLIDMQLLTFEEEGRKVVRGDIPSELSDDAELARQAMLEELSTTATT